MPDKTNGSAGEIMPRWFSNDLVTPFRAGIASEFIVHGDINCLVKNPEGEDEPDAPYIPLRRFWESVFSERDMVIFYNIASGMRFLTSEMEKKFKKLAGLDEEEKDKGKDAKDPLLAALEGVAGKKEMPRDPESCFPLIEKVLKSMRGVAVVVQSAHFIAPATSGGISLAPNERVNVERLKNWAQDEEIRANENIVLLLTDQAAKVSPELRQSGGEVQTIFIPKPSKEERKAFVVSLTEGSQEYRRIKKEHMILDAQRKGRRKSSASRLDLEEKIQECEETLSLFPDVFDMGKNLDPDVFAIATQGMGLRQIFEIFLQARKTNQGISLAYVKEKKREILNSEYGDVMQIVDPEKGLEDIGGLVYVKNHFVTILEAIKKGEIRLIPMGATLMGPPGTGKTAIVEALAKEAGFNFVKIKNIRSMWVGESEARMEKLLYGLRSLAPVVVMNDEADLAEAGRDSPKGDSGVSERLMKMWMELLSDPRIRGQIIVISCTNRPDRMDPALKRSGRSDDRILLPMPSFEERLAIFPVMFRRYKIPTSLLDFSFHAKMSDGLSGADIEKITLNSYKFASEQGEKEVDDNALRAAIEDFIPSASQAEIDLMTLMGLLECSSRRLLPPNIKEIVAGIKKRNLVANLGEILAQINERNIVKLDEKEGE